MNKYLIDDLDKLDSYLFYKGLLTVKQLEKVFKHVKQNKITNWNQAEIYINKILKGE